jgi:hypothetical protein
MNVSVQNESPLNKAAWKRLKEARESPPQHHLYLLSLAAWGLEQRVEGDWPERERYALQEQVNILFGWKPENVVAWLLSNPNGPDKEEEGASLLQAVRDASSPQNASSAVLNAIWAVQQAECPALQPAASELR